DSLRRATPLPAPVLPSEGDTLQVHADIAPFRVEAIRPSWHRLSFVPTGASRRTLWGAQSLTNTYCILNRMSSCKSDSKRLTGERSFPGRTQRCVEIQHHQPVEKAAR